MNILVITGTTEPTSGLGRYSHEVIRELQRQGERVLVMSERGEADIKLLQKAGFVSFLANVLRARAAARGSDAVHVFDAWPYAIYGSVAVLGRRIKFYMSGIGTYSLPPAKLSFKRLLLLGAYYRAQHVFSISRYTQERIAARLPFRSAMSVVHMGNTLLPRPSVGATEHLREKYHISPDACVVLTVGEVKDRKGQLDTALAVLRLRRKISRIVYVMVGSDADSTYIERIRTAAHSENATDACLIVTDAKSDEDIAGWYSMADVFVLASNNDLDHFEGFGLVFLEAGQFGVPGIGSRNCGIEDAVIDGSTGILVPQRDPQATANAIELTLQHRKEFGQAARAFASTFSWRATVESYRRLYYS